MTTDAALNRQLVLDDEYFLVHSFSNALAGQFSHAQLWNPAASGVRVEISSIAVSIEDLADTLRLVIGTDDADTLTGTGLSMLDGSTASVAQARRQDSVGVIGGTTVQAIDLGVGVPFTVPGLDRVPIILTPGNGVTIRGGLNNNGFNSNFIWRELPG